MQALGPNEGLVIENYVTGQRRLPAKSDILLETYMANTRGAEKNVTWITSLVDVAAELSAKVRESGVLSWTEPLAKATLIAAPLCAIPEAIGFGIESARSWVNLATDVTLNNLKKAAGKTLKVAQRAVEALYGMMKLGVIDAALSVATKLGKDLLSCPLDLLKVGEAVKADKEAMAETSKKVRDLWEMENHFNYMQGVVGFAFHAMNCAAVLCASAVTVHMVTALATVYTITVLGTFYYADEKMDAKNELATKSRLAEKAKEEEAEAEEA